MTVSGGGEGWWVVVRDVLGVAEGGRPYGGERLGER